MDVQVRCFLRFENYCGGLSVRFVYQADRIEPAKLVPGRPCIEVKLRGVKNRSFNIMPALFPAFRRRRPEVGGGSFNALLDDHQGFRRQVIEQAFSLFKKQWQVLFQTLRV